MARRGDGEHGHAPGRCGPTPWDVDGKAIPLPGLVAGEYSSASAVNDSGVVAGTAEAASIDNHAVRWSADGTIYRPLAIRWAASR
jgi:hypothetical protein